jgi:molybdopterin-binding protein
VGEILTVDGLLRRHGGDVVLDVPSLGVEEGEVLAVIGPNGSGKSTLLRVVDLLERPTAGDIVYWDGSRLSRLGRRERVGLARQMAMVFQEPLLFRRSVRANVAYGLRARRVEKEEARRRVSETLEMLGLEGFEERYAPSLSGGEAQKVALARALAVRPRLLLLDEPFASLDHPTRQTLRAEISVLLRRIGTTCIYVTHDHLEALEMADRLAVLIGGRIRQVGSPVEVFSRPASREVADFVGAENLVEAVAVASGRGSTEVKVDGVRLEIACEHPPGSRLLLMIHPEEVTLLRESAGVAESSARNLLPGTVEDLTLMGALYKVRLDCGFPLISYVTRGSREALGLEKGSRLSCSFKASAVHVIPRSR